MLRARPHFAAAVRSRLIATALFLATGSNVALGATYKCTSSSGRVTLQDVPCEGPAGAVHDERRERELRATIERAGSPASGSSSTRATSDYSTARGAWRGPAQFHLVVGGQRDLAAHRIAPLVIELGADGKVQGVVTEAGCTLAGLATQLVTPAMANVDVTLKGCTDSRFNVRLSGNLNSSAGAKEAKLYLAAVGYTPGMKVQQLTLEAVLRR